MTRLTVKCFRHVQLLYEFVSNATQWPFITIYYAISNDHDNYMRIKFYPLIKHFFFHDCQKF